MDSAGTGLGWQYHHYNTALTHRPDTADVVYSYRKSGALDSVKYPQADLIATYAYNLRHLPDSVVTRINTVDTLFKQVLGYDTTGQIIWQRYRHLGQSEVKQNYYYDSIGQLTRWTDNRTGTTDIAYQYDHVGNRESYSGTAAGWYQYIAGRNRLWNATENAPVSQHFDWYDENGSLQSSLWLAAGTGSMTGLQKKEDLTFSYRGLPSTYTIATAGGSRTWEYRYNALGEREQKRVVENCADTVHAGEHNYTHTNPGTPQPWTYYHLGIDQAQLGVWHGSRTCKESCVIGGIFDLLYYPAEYTGYGLLGGEVTVYPDGQKRYNVKDNLGSTRAGVMPLDSAMNRTHYLPFGGEAVTGVPTREAFIDKEKDVEDGTNNLACGTGENLQ